MIALRAAWIALLEPNAVPCAPILEVPQVFAHRQVVHRGLRIEREDACWGPQDEAPVPIANAAALTTRLRLGTLVLAVDYRHPVMLAKEVTARFHGAAAGAHAEEEFESLRLALCCEGLPTTRVEETA